MSGFIKQIRFKRYVVDIKTTVRNTPETISNVPNQFYHDIEITLE